MRGSGHPRADQQQREELQVAQDEGVAERRAGELEERAARRGVADEVAERGCEGGVREVRY